MSTERAILQFLGYRVDELLFAAKKELSGTTEQIVLEPSFSRTIKQAGSEEYDVTIGVKLEQNDLPFEARLSLTGRFKCEDVSDVPKMLKVNAVAILYPYVRATLSMLTTIAAVPPVIVPTINLAKMFEQEEQSKLLEAKD